MHLTYEMMEIRKLETRRKCKTFLS